MRTFFHLEHPRSTKYCITFSIEGVEHSKKVSPHKLDVQFVHKYSVPSYVALKSLAKQTRKRKMSAQFCQGRRKKRLYTKMLYSIVKRQKI